jgi:hypothetical protein
MQGSRRNIGLMRAWFHVGTFCGSLQNSDRELELRFCTLGLGERSKLLSKTVATLQTALEVPQCQQTSYKQAMNFESV